MNNDNVTVVTFLPKPRIQYTTAKELNSRIVSKMLNANPVGQRLSTDNSSHKKSAEIIVSIFNGGDIGELTENFESETLMSSTIDGGHRCRAINLFYSGSFALPKKPKLAIPTSDGQYHDISGLRYNQLPQVIRSYFDQYEIRECVYDNLPSMQQTRIFRDRNQSTQTNHQEMMNAASDNLVAIAIREKVRTIPDHKSKFQVHELFALKYSGDKIKAKHLSFMNKRLVHEEFLSVVTIYAVNNAIVDAGDYKIEDLYEQYGDEVHGSFAKDQKLYQKVLDRVDGCLDFLVSVAGGMRKLYGSGSMTHPRLYMATRYYFYLISQKREFKLNNPALFAGILSKAIYDLTGKTGGRSGVVPPAEKWEKMAVDPSLVREVGFVSVANKMSEWMKGYNAEAKKAIQTVKWLQEAMDDIDEDQGILFKDKKRSLSREEKHILLAQQDFICPVDGEELSYEDAEAGHIIAHCNGGETTMSNSRMIRRKWNREQGSLDMDDYIKSWREQRGLD